MEVDRMIDYGGINVIPFGSVLHQQGVKIRVLVEERRTTMCGSLVVEDRMVGTEARDGWVWGHDPSRIHSLVSDMLNTIPSLLPYNTTSVATLVSNHINYTLLQPPYFFFLDAGLQITSLIHLHTTQHFDEFEDDLMRTLTIQQQQEDEEDDDDEEDNPYPRIEIESLPIKTYNVAVASDDGGCCAVCLEDFIQSDQVSELPCSHIFHTDCILPWLKRKPSCPTCRSLISS